MTCMSECDDDVGLYIPSCPVSSGEQQTPPSRCIKRYKSAAYNQKVDLLPVLNHCTVRLSLLSNIIPMVSSKLLIATALAVFGLLCLSNGAQASPPKPEPSPSFKDAGRKCDTLKPRDYNLITSGNTGKVTKVGNGLYQAKDSKDQVRWEVQIDPLKITSYKGQLSAANAIVIVLNRKSFLFSVAEGTQCSGTTDNHYLDYVFNNEHVDDVMHYKLQRLPSS